MRTQMLAGRPFTACACREAPPDPAAVPGTGGQLGDLRRARIAGRRQPAHQAAPGFLALPAGEVDPAEPDERHHPVGQRRVQQQRHRGVTWPPGQLATPVSSAATRCSFTVRAWPAAPRFDIGSRLPSPGRQVPGQLKLDPPIVVVHHDRRRVRRPAGRHNCQARDSAIVLNGSATVARYFPISVLTRGGIGVWRPQDRDAAAAGPP